MKKLLAIKRAAAILPLESDVLTLSLSKPMPIAVTEASSDTAATASDIDWDKLECTQILMEGWTKWSDAQLWRRVFLWGANQRQPDNQVVRAYPGFEKDGGKHVVYVFKGREGAELELDTPRLVEAIGYREAGLTEIHLGRCHLVPFKVHDLFQRTNRSKLDGFQAALPSMTPIGHRGDKINNVLTEHLCVRDAHWEDIRSGDLGDPDRVGDPTGFIKRVIAYGEFRGFAFAFPTFEEARYSDRGLVFGVNFFESNLVERRLLFDSELPATARL